MDCSPPGPSVYGGSPGKIHEVKITTEREKHKSTVVIEDFSTTLSIIGIASE